MRILVAGSGAVGGYFGAMLYKSGCDVKFLARGAHLEAIRRDGLFVKSSRVGELTIHPDVRALFDDSWVADLVLFCVKGYDNPSAIDAIRGAVTSETTILTLQNGVGSGDELADVFGRESVLLGVTYIDSTREKPGVIGEMGGKVDIIFGEPDGSRTSRVTKIRGVLDVPGIDVTLSTDISKEIWSKLVYICGLSGMTCITRASFADVLDNPATLELTRLVVSEVKAVASAKGIAIDNSIVDATMERYWLSSRNATSSMYTDLQNESRLEIAVLNGAVFRLGKELGVPTPVNKFITSCLTLAHNRAVAKGG